MPAPRVPTEPAPKVEEVRAPGGGLKFDGGKVRTDLLPAVALDAVSTALVVHPFVEASPWDILQGELASWRCGSKLIDGHRRMALVAGALLILLTRELRGDVRVARLLPACGPALTQVAWVLTFGAQKYGPNNWQGLTDFEDRYYAALLRHTYAHGGGETLDKESGLHHLAHAACCALFLLSKEVGFDTHT